MFVRDERGFFACEVYFASAKEKKYEGREKMYDWAVKEERSVDRGDEDAIRSNGMR